MRRFLLMLVAVAAFATTIGIVPGATTSVDARPWRRAGVRAYARPYYRPYYRSNYRPAYYGRYYGGYYGPYGRFYYNW